MSARRVRDFFGTVVVDALLIAVVAACSAIATPAGATARVHASSGPSGVALAGLPAEAAATVALIEAGGPFPYRQDGATFQNREGLLPSEPAGYYREYTVETPGSEDRGARRIIAGKGGELYWTDDHYASFTRIDR
jgi:ribonuclease T1